MAIKYVIVHIKNGTKKRALASPRKNDRNDTIMRC